MYRTLILPSPSVTTPRSVRVSAWLRPRPMRPKYFEYLPRVDIERRQIEECLHLTRTDREITETPEMTWKSCLRFLPGFIRFYVIPAYFRYIFYRFQKFLRNFLLYPLQMKMALWDAQFDALLYQLTHRERRFALGMSLCRLHGRIGPGRELRYRLGLLLGKPLDSWKELVEEDEERERVIVWTH